MTTEGITTLAGLDVVANRGEMVHPDPAHPGLGVRMIPTSTVADAIRKVEAEMTMRGRAQAQYLRDAMLLADDYLNVRGDPVAAHITLVNALERGEA